MLVLASRTGDGAEALSSALRPAAFLPCNPCPERAGRLLR